MTPKRPVLSAFKWLLSFRKPLLTGCTLLFLSATGSGQAPAPGGVGSGLSTWFKANTTNSANLTIPVTGTNRVSQWRSEVNNFTVSQTITGQQPVFTAAATTIGNFNFNPFIQFSKASGTVLYNTATTPDLLGTNGTVFLVINTNAAGADGNPSGFTYKSSFSAGYQFKPAFRIQTGDGISGGTGDFTPSAPVNYTPTAGLILAVKGVDKNTTQRFFSPRRNGDSLSVTHRYDLPNDGYSYTPIVPFGLFLGSDGTSTSGQNMSCGLAEVITFNSYLSELDQNKVESYLAIKYGLTLTANRLSTVRSYRSAIGTVIWDSVANAGYGNNITGIGQDTTSSLLQKQSQSVLNNALIALYNGNTAGNFPATNLLNTSTITGTNTFLLAGDNGSATTLTQCASGNQVARMARVWKVQKTGTGIDDVTIAVSSTAVPATVKNLLVSTNPGFPSGSTTLYPLQTAGGRLFAVVRLNSGEFFTFGTDSLKVALTPVTPSCTDPQSGSITATVSGGATPYTYTWAPGGQTTANLANVAAGTYTLTVTQGGACPVAVQATINAAVLPAAPVVNGLSVCRDSSAVFTVTNPVSGYTYRWYSVATGGTALPVTAPGTSFTSPALTANTTYYVEAVSNTGCTSNTRTPATATLLQALTQPVVATGTVTVNSVVFNWNAVAGAASYLVSVNGGAYAAPSSGATGTTHIVTGLQPLSTVTIRVVAVGAAVCQNSLAGLDTARTLTNEIYIPNAFTPNGDGRNDVWLVYGPSITGIEMAVFNQWGEKIFETRTANTGWNGTYKGKPQPVGVYTYVIKVQAGGTEMLRKGSLNLIR